MYTGKSYFAANKNVTDYFKAIKDFTTINF